MVLELTVDPASRLKRFGLDSLYAREVTTLQVNVGKLCNQACHHCHVDAGPHRTEIMTRGTVDAVLAAVRRWRVPNVDITGGAPELNPNFEYLVEQARNAGSHVIVRHNLTVQFVAGKEHLPDFFRSHEAEVIASLPCYEEDNTDSQRGRGVFEKSIAALRRLNAAGYGHPESGLILNLVHNPVGPYLPPDQTELEADYREALRLRHGIVFSHLYTITNMPISRFLHDLRRSGKYESYMDTLVNAFNPKTLDGLMCRSLVSVGWDGRLYDCDFNQMLEMALTEGQPMTIGEFDAFVLARRRIATGPHCLGCTAGAGSSCGGAVAKV